GARRRGPAHRAGGLARLQPGLRCDAGRIHQRHRHGTRHLPVPVRFRLTVPLPRWGRRTVSGMPSRNQDISSVREYRARTKHSPESVRASGHRLDWSIQPLPFKIYPDLPAIALPRDFPAASTDTLAALSGRPDARSALDLERLAA